MNASNQNWFRTCQYHHHPPVGFIFIIPIVLFFLYESKFHNYWPIIIFIFFIFLLIIPRHRYTGYIRKQPNDSYQSGTIPINYATKTDFQIMKPNYCKNCGSTIELDAKYCSNCGTNLF